MIDRRQDHARRVAYWEAHQNLLAAMEADATLMRAQRMAEQAKQEAAMLWARLREKVPG